MVRYGARHGRGTAKGLTRLRRAFAVAVLLPLALAMVTVSPASAEAPPTWTVASSGTNPPDVGLLACTGPTTCLAVAPGLQTVGTTDDGGASWSVATTITNGSAGASSLACMTDSRCVAAGGVSGASSVTDAVSVTEDRGSSWTETTFGTGNGLTGVSCGTAMDCVAVGSVGQTASAVFMAVFTTSDGGANWVHQTGSISTQGGWFDGVSCTSALDCYAVVTPAGPDAGNELMSTADGGVTWSTSSTFPYYPSPEPSTSTEPAYVGCLSPMDCVVAGNTPPNNPSIYTTADGGATWVDRELPPDTPPFSVEGATCPITNDCLIFGRNIPASGPAAGVILDSTDGGASWTDQSLPSDVTNVISVSCLTTASCLATGYTAESTSVLLTTSPTSTTPMPAGAVGGAVLAVGLGAVFVGWQRRHRHSPIGAR